ncbi:MAG TPA: hypothetical protein VGL46_17790 [Pseudonocardiaceae bacterium]|jgi:hypothetical protein
MAEQPPPEEEPDDAASPVPNRRERRGKKAAAVPSPDGKSAVGRRTAPPAPSRQYSTRRRSG